MSGKGGRSRLSWADLIERGNLGQLAGLANDADGLARDTRTNAEAVADPQQRAIAAAGLRTFADQFAGYVNLLSVAAREHEVNADADFMAGLWQLSHYASHAADGFDGDADAEAIAARLDALAAAIRRLEALRADTCRAAT